MATYVERLGHGSDDAGPTERPAELFAAAEKILLIAGNGHSFDGVNPSRGDLSVDFGTHLTLSSADSAPRMFLPLVDIPKFGLVLIRIQAVVPNDTRFAIQRAAEEDSITLASRLIQGGYNELYFSLFAKECGGGIFILPGHGPGEYRFLSIEIRYTEHDSQSLA